MAIAPISAGSGSSLLALRAALLERAILGRIRVGRDEALGPVRPMEAGAAPAAARAVAGIAGAAGATGVTGVTGVADAKPIGAVASVDPAPAREYGPPPALDRRSSSYLVAGPTAAPAVVHGAEPASRPAATPGAGSPDVEDGDAQAIDAEGGNAAAKEAAAKEAEGAGEAGETGAGAKPRRRGVGRFGPEGLSDRQIQERLTELEGEKARGERKRNGDVSSRSAEVLRVLSALKARDGEVRAHEAAHVATGGRYVTGGASYAYQKGPDGRQYAVGGEVGIDSSPVAGKPEETAAKMRIVRAAALAPAEPSGADNAVAAAAAQTEAAAYAEIAALRRAGTASETGPAGGPGGPGAVVDGAGGPAGGPGVPSDARGVAAGPGGVSRGDAPGSRLDLFA